jgi:hypothetical protein
MFNDDFYLPLYLPLCPERWGGGGGDGGLSLGRWERLGRRTGEAGGRAYLMQSM